MLESFWFLFPLSPLLPLLKQLLAELRFEFEHSLRVGSPAFIAKRLQRALRLVPQASRLKSKSPTGTVGNNHPYTHRDFHHSVILQYHVKVLTWPSPSSFTALTKRGRSRYILRQLLCSLLEKLLAVARTDTRTYNWWQADPRPLPFNNPISPKVNCQQFYSGFKVRAPCTS